MMTLSELLANRHIVVPNYQRAYSWDTKRADNAPGQVYTFLKDLEDYVESKSSTPYYYGHFLFEQRENEREYAIIDGQQRLTTAIIFLSALYRQLLEKRRANSIRELSDSLFVTYCNTIKQGDQYRFSTVEYDERMFRDYVIEQTVNNRNGFDTRSQARIADAFDYFMAKLAGENEDTLLALHSAISEAACTTHEVKSPTEAVQMFIFQNNRGKKPTNLEVIKAQFMYTIHLNDTEDRVTSHLKEIEDRFGRIYRSITTIDGNLDEDDVLTYAIKVYRNNLGYVPSLEYINEELRKSDSSVEFVLEFSKLLESCFTQVETFMREEKENFKYHSLCQSAYRAIMFPFMIKAMRNGMDQSNLDRLAESLDQIFLRHWIVGTRAALESRLGDCYKEMEKDAQGVVDRVAYLKTAEGWCGYWNNNEIARCLKRELDHELAKVLLWKYENYLISKDHKGYKPIRYDSIEKPQLEHIAPRAENRTPGSGYCAYDEEFCTQYLDTLGNYLLLSGAHNGGVSNRAFAEKRASYTHLQQQKEVQEMTSQDATWDKAKIAQRQEAIEQFLMSVL